MASKNRLIKDTAAEIQSQSMQDRKHAIKRPRKSSLQAGGVLLSLAGVLACNYLGLGVGRAICHGLLVASLGAPMHSSPSKRARA